MTLESANSECPAELLAQLVDTMRSDGEAALEQMDGLLADYPQDARLHFLKGSVLASLRRYEEARASMHQAIAVAPGYAIARFQTGFLELTSGNAALAQAVWQPLEALAPNDPLRLFAAGLRHLANDEFDSAIAVLEEGIGLNTAIPPLNADMRLIIDEIRRRPPPEAPAETSASHLLLQQYLAKTTKH